MSSKKHPSTRPTSGPPGPDTTKPQSTQPTWTNAADSFPEPLQPAVVMVLGLLRAVAPLVQAFGAFAWKMGKLAAYIAVWLSPALLWAGNKWFQWYIMSYVRKAERVLKWVLWAVNFLPKGSGGGGGSA